MQAFDLNVEKVLEHWSPAHALREVIANALDEHALLGRAIGPRSSRTTPACGTSATTVAGCATST